MIKVRPELKAIAERVCNEFASEQAEPGSLDAKDVERAIAAQARATGAKPFSEQEESQLIALRSWAMKSPDKRVSTK